MIASEHLNIGVTFITDPCSVCCDAAERIDESRVRIQGKSTTDAGGVERR